MLTAIRTVKAPRSSDRRWCMVLLSSQKSLRFVAVTGAMEM
jgi:hypothetical protein